MKISEIITDKYKLRIPPTVYYELLADVQEVEEEQEPTTKNDLVTIHTEGLDIGIRCAMCTNSMKSDRGCDGSCVVDKDMYKKVMDVIESNIVVEPTTKIDLEVDCISRQAVIDLMMQKWGENFSGDDAMQESIDAIRDLPSVTPQLSSELEKNSKKLEKDFGELDCISRADAIRVASGYCHPSNVAKELAKLPKVTPQEPFKPMVEIDLYSVIKQKYIEREVLDKIRAQIKSNLRGVEITLEVLAENHPLRPKMEGAKDTLEECLELIDKAETEDQE